MLLPGIHPRWNELLIWLKSHGMPVDDLPIQARECQGTGFGLCAIRPVPASTPLFTVPKSALLNILTLSPHYPRSNPPLTAVQLIALHLALYRSGTSYPFEPYISILPPNFAFHPLTWLHRRTRRLASTDEDQLLGILPISILESLDKLRTKFEADWKRVSDYLKGNRTIYEDLHLQYPNPIDKEMRFLWGWLDVNTRCIYHHICHRRSDPDNISLCPILDFANHTAGGPHMSPMFGGIALQSSTPKSKNADVTLVSPATVMTENEEMYLIYGAHCNKRLFVEYGFVNWPPVETRAEEASGEVDVQTYVEKLFEERGKTGEWMKTILEGEGYWGDWTIHGSIVPAYPSFRLIAALRLSSLRTEEGAPAGLIQAWKATIAGTREYISEENEELWRTALVEICQMVETEGEIGLSRAREAVIVGRQCWEKAARENILKLWEEEVSVAKAVRVSVETGVAF